MGQVLVDWQIEKEIVQGNIKVSPFDSKLINPNSLDVRLGGKFGIVLAYGDDFGKPNPKSIGKYVNPLDSTSFKTVYMEEDTYLLRPGEFILAHLLEDITLPDNICGKIMGKSSLGRLGLSNSHVAGWVDAGWSGVLTLELFNQSSNKILLSKGMKIGQMVFYLTERAARPYNQTGRYSNQVPATGSLGV